MRYLKLFEDNSKFVQFSQLVGKVVDSIYLDVDSTGLCFLCDDGSYHTYYTCGDCCNSVWFTHLSGYDVLLNQRVLTVESKDWREIEHHLMGGDDCEEACTWTLTTKRGYIDIEVRNNHNGYYGGSVEYTAGLGLLMRLEFIKQYWVEIHDDF